MEEMEEMEEIGKGTTISVHQSKMYCLYKNS